MARSMASDVGRFYRAVVRHIRRDTGDESVYYLGPFQRESDARGAITHHKRQWRFNTNLVITGEIQETNLDWALVEVVE